MRRREYREPQPISRSEAASAFASGIPNRICETLVSLAYYDPDWRWVQVKCLEFSRHSDPDVRGLAATCLGHLARIHRQLDTAIVVPRLNEMLTDPDVKGTAQDALDDISLFIGRP